MSLDPMLQAHLRVALLKIGAEIDGRYQAVRDLAKEHIEDFHFVDYAVSLFWTCDLSPIGMCVFELDDFGRKTRCRYCGGGVERK